MRGGFWIAFGAVAGAPALALLLLAAAFRAA